MCESFLTGLFQKTSDSETFTEKSSEEKMEDLINKKLKMMVKGQDQPVLPLESYFKQFEINF